MTQHRIVRYCDGVLFAVEEFVKGEWQYAPVFKPRANGEVDVRDMTFDTVDKCRAAIERRKAKEKERVIEVI